MKYLLTTFTLTPYSEDACDVLSAQLADIGYETFLPTAQGIEGYVQKAAYDEAELMNTIRDFMFPGITISFHTEEAPDEDWNQTWEAEGFEPVVLDDLISVHDTQHAVPPCRYDIIINPRMAFGTGTHPTTQQILRQLTKMDIQGKRIIDAGCGTGVLGILASMRGAKWVFGYDIDEWSVENTRINAELNGTENIEVHEGDASILPKEGDYDLLIANINRNILLADMERFAQALRKEDAQLLLSGFYEEDIPLLADKGKSLGFTLEKKSCQEGWAMLLLARP